MPPSERERPRFACRHCASTFKRKEHMTRHERSHTAERPYECASCETAFTRKDLLVRHMRTCAAAQTQRATDHSHKTARYHHQSNGSASASAPTSLNATTRAHTTPPPEKTRNSSIEDDDEDDALDTPAKTVLPVDVRAAALSRDLFAQYDHLIQRRRRSRPRGGSRADAHVVVDEDGDVDINDADSDSNSASGLETDDSSDSGYSSIASAGTFSSISDDTLLDDFHHPALTDACVTALTAIVAIVTGSADTASLTMSDSAAELSTYIATYRGVCAPALPVLHFTVFEPPLSSLSADELTSPPAAGRAMALLAAAALGASHVGQHDRARTLRDVCRACVAAVYAAAGGRGGSDVADEALALGAMQARLLCASLDAWDGERERVERALDEQPAQVRACVAGITRWGARSAQDWHGWVVRESLHRVYWGFYAYMSTLYLSYGDICPLPRIGTERLPLPEADALWTARGPHEWAAACAVSGRGALAEQETCDVALADVLLGSAKEDDGVENVNYRRSTFATTLLLRHLLHHLSTTNHALRFGGGSRPAAASIELDYLRTLSFEQVDRVVSRIGGGKDAQPSQTPRGVRALSAALVQMIAMRRLNLPATRRMGVLSRVVLGEHLGLDLEEALENRCRRSARVTGTLARCLAYVRPYLLGRARVRTVEDLLCTGESVLCLILWIRTIELNYAQGTPVQPEEARMIDDVTKIVTSKRNTHRPPEKDKMYLTTRLACTWSGVLRAETELACAEQVCHFLESLVARL
ncbi:uncharacterized protein V1518DRAFT_420746 [Limtongia smithiae]|uniref:uncharacterized protein n=1 Tax=Limtongia smithiae TaxID=1125753 RepID=UPI0034CEB323